MKVTIKIMQFTLVLFSAFAFSQATAKEVCDCTGTLTKNNFRVGQCSVRSMTVKYKVGHFFGEPTVNGTYKWQAGTGTKQNCLPSDLKVWLKIKNGTSYGYIGLAPTVPKADGGYGYNVTGSPNWNSFICGYSGTRERNCFNPDSAKRIYKGGSIVGFELSHK